VVPLQARPTNCCTRRAKRTRVSNSVRRHDEYHLAQFEMKACLLVCCSFVLASCAGVPVADGSFPSVYAAAVPVCDLRLRPEAFVGRRVAVRGLYALTPHQRVLTDNACPTEEVEIELGERSGYLRKDEQMSQLFRKAGSIGVRAVYSGLVKSRQSIVGCQVPGCSVYSLVDAKLESVEWRLR